MKSLAEELTEAVDRECRVIPFQEDHEGKTERIEEMMLREARQARKRLRKAKSDEKAELAAIAAERARLDERERNILEGTAAKVAAENRRIAKCKAFIAEGA